MDTIDYKKLQNGSDIRGIALPGVEGEEVNLTEEVIANIASAFANWLSQKTDKDVNSLKISIGHDSRLSAYDIKSIISTKLASKGMSVFDSGLSSTPAMFMSTIFEQWQCDGAIMITASHLPWNRNGFKFFTKNGGLDKQDIKDILERAENVNEKDPKDRLLSNISRIELMDAYCDFLKNKIQKEVNSEIDYEQPLRGLKIVVDAGNGGGGFYALDILQPLGANINGSQFLDPDGNFPNHPSNPENSEAIKSLKKAVLESEADLGLIFDTDVDRSSAVDNEGNEINRNAIVALAAALVAEEHPGTTIVTDSITSDGLTDFIENKLKLKHHRFMRGYKNVINESIRLNEEKQESWLAIETSGHAALKENYFLDDGAYLATKIVIKLAQMRNSGGENINSLIADLKQPLEEKEYRVKIEAEDFSSYGDQVIKDLRNFAESKEGLTIVKPNFEGIRIAFNKENGNGWALLRKSLHDPLLVLNVESNIKGGVEKISESIFSIINR